MTSIASDRIRNTRQNCPFIQVLYAEKLHKYNLIAAVHVTSVEQGSEEKNNGYLQIIHGLAAGMDGIDIVYVQAFFLKNFFPCLCRGCGVSQGFAHRILRFPDSQTMNLYKKIVWI